MYAVIRAGGKQYRVAPGDVIHVERQPAQSGKIEFADILAASSSEGHIARPQQDGARVYGRVLEEGRADKILVFHYKRKKQYKKLAGHRQPFSRVKITEIVFDGHSYKATEDAAETKKLKAAKATHAEKPAHEHKAEHKHMAPAAKKSGSKAKAHHKSGAKSTSKKKK